MFPGATWRSGDAADCKSVYPGSIPGVASNLIVEPAIGALPAAAAVRSPGPSARRIEAARRAAINGGFPGQSGRATIQPANFESGSRQPNGGGAMTVEKLNSLLNWQLKHGSHDFPGPDGGTCINEAALVVAGFAYREVTSIEDLPEFFCPVISQYCLTLNDAMPEGETLNRLMPFAARLAGSGDGRRTADRRALYLASRTAGETAALAIDAIQPDAAARLRSAGSPEAQFAELEELLQLSLPDNVHQSVGAAHRALDRALKARSAIYTAELSAICAVRAAAVDERAWDIAIDILEGVLSIGKQAEQIDADMIKHRAEAVLAQT